LNAEKVVFCCGIDGHNSISVQYAVISINLLSYNQKTNKVANLNFYDELSLALTMQTNQTRNDTYGVIWASFESINTLSSIMMTTIEKRGGGKVLKMGKINSETRRYDNIRLYLAIFYFLRPQPLIKSPQA
jgi:hypothetical protein